MKIIIYNPNTKAWSDFIESLSGIRGSKRDNLIIEHIEEIGTEISAKEFYDNSYKYTSWCTDEKFKFIGEPTTAFEKILKFMYNSASYIHMRDSFPEDFVESRTDWDAMEGYADEMASFIQEIANDLSTS